MFINGCLGNDENNNNCRTLVLPMTPGEYPYKLTVNFVHNIKFEINSKIILCSNTGDYTLVKASSMVLSSSNTFNLSLLYLIDLRSNPAPKTTNCSTFSMLHLIN